MKVLIPQDIDEAGKIYLRERGYEVVVGSGCDPETIKREVVDCDALLVRTAEYPADVVAAGKKLKIIARYGVGTDNIAVEEATKRGIWVTIAKGENVRSVTEHAITMVLSCAKNLVYCDRGTKAGNWELRNTFPGTEVGGKTLGIIGLGAIGRQVAQLAHDGLSMEIIGYDAFLPAGLPDYIETVQDTDEIFKRADFITLHVPAIPGTHNMVDRRTLGLMKPTAYLINCARGGVVNEDDLYDALKNGTIAGAAMDVFVVEPARPDNRLFTLEKFIASPHSAGLTKESMVGVALSCARAIDDVLSGRKPQYPVNNPF